MTETWRSIPGWQDYEVSDLGCVRSLDRYRPHNMRAQQFVPGKVLHPTLSSAGYPQIKLRRGKRDYIMIGVHRLVAMAFLEPDEARPHINHIDSDQTNNRLNNLERCTARENIAHAKANGRLSKKRQGLGARALSDADVLSIRKLYAEGGHSTVSLGKQFLVHPTSISRIVRRKSYVHI